MFTFRILYNFNYRTYPKIKRLFEYKNKLLFVNR